MSSPWRIVPVQNRLAVVFNVCHHSAGANPLFDGWVRVKWLGRWTQQWAAECVYDIHRRAFETGL